MATLRKPRALLSEAQWSQIQPLLPVHKPSANGGRPRAPDRACLEGLLWMLRTGAPWADLPGAFPSPSTCWRRLSGWEADGTWERIWRSFLATLDQRGRLDWEESFMDATFVMAKKGAPQSGRPSGARARSSWWWWTARVFLWESTWRRPRRRR